MFLSVGLGDRVGGRRFVLSVMTVISFGMFSRNGTSPPSPALT